MEWWGTLLVSLASAIVSGFISGLFTIHVEKRKQKKEDEKRLSELLKKANEKKPRFEIESYVDLGPADKKPALKKEKPFNLLVLGIVDFEDVGGKPVFKYDKRALDKNEYVYVEYHLINSGLTEIEDVCFTSNIPRIMALFALDSDTQLVKNQILNYEAWHDQRYIKPGEGIVVHIYYVKDMIPTTILGSPELIVWFRGVDGYLWRQALYSPGAQIEYPVMSNESEFKEARDTKKAIECFRNPIMW